MVDGPQYVAVNETTRSQLGELQTCNSFQLVDSGRKH